MLSALNKITVCAANEGSRMEINMENLNNNQIHGIHNGNKRINKKYRLESEETAAWTNAVSKAPKTNVSIPSNDAVDNAKDWVDNGSRL